MAQSQANKISKAAQALKKNHSILVTSGSGFTADSGMHYLRGTIGLWNNYPAFKKQKITFDDLVEMSFFESQPKKFWYVFGDLYNKYNAAQPHDGYKDLQDILGFCKPDGNWFAYHEGVDDLYQKSGLPEKKLMQGKGNIFYWQCKPCSVLEKFTSYKFQLNHEKGEAKKIPLCKKCNKPVRPNINFRNDLDWIETIAEEQNKAFFEWLKPNIQRSITVIEIGAGPVQPLAREVGENLLKDDKYRCALIRINPFKERRSQYLWEKEQIHKLVKDEDFNESTKLPNFMGLDNKHITQEEDKQYKALKNELIEIEMGAKEALMLIKQQLMK